MTPAELIARAREAAGDAERSSLNSSARYPTGSGVAPWLVRDLAAALEAAEAAEARAAALAEGLREAVGVVLDAPNLDFEARRSATARLRALLAAGPEDAARELAGLRALLADVCELGHVGCSSCMKMATKVVTAHDLIARRYCDEHAPPRAEELLWAQAVRGAGR